MGGLCMGGLCMGGRVLKLPNKMRIWRTCFDKGHITHLFLFING